MKIKHYNFYLKPNSLKDWVIIKKTKKCLVIRKTFKQRYGYKNFIGDCIYLPIKSIERQEEIKMSTQIQPVKCTISHSIYQFNKNYERSKR